MGEQSNEATMRFSPKEIEMTEVRLILRQVCNALKDKGYDPWIRWWDTFCRVIRHILPTTVMPGF